MGHAKTKRENLEQTLLLLQYSSDEGISIYDIASELSCDPSTAHRYLRELEQEYPLVEVSRGRYRIERTKMLSNIRLYPTEALTIYLALRRFIRQTSYAPDFMISALQKITPALQRPDLVETLTQAVIRLQQERSSPPEYAAVWETLIRCWVYQRVIRIQYQGLKNTDLVEHVIEPYLFEPMPFGDGTYLIAWSRTRNSLRTFKPERIASAVETNDAFEKRVDIDIDDLLKQAWGIWYGETTVQIVLKFHPQVARRVLESVYMTGEQKILKEDGSLIWCVDIVGTLEILSWIRGWGPYVEVLEPLELREQIKRELYEALRLYE